MSKHEKNSQVGHKRLIERKCATKGKSSHLHNSKGSSNKVKGIYIVIVKSRKITKILVPP